MDILIKNIGGLPEDGDLTLTITPKGQVILGGCIYTSNFGKEVKAVALPEHHGRLGDLDLLEEWMRKKHKEHDCPFNIDAFLVALKRFPTIVEANNGTDS